MVLIRSSTFTCLHVFLFESCKKFLHNIGWIHRDIDMWTKNLTFIVIKALSHVLIYNWNFQWKTGSCWWKMVGIGWNKEFLCSLCLCQLIDLQNWPRDRYMFVIMYCIYSYSSHTLTPVFLIWNIYAAIVHYIFLSGTISRLQNRLHVFRCLPKYKLPLNWYIFYFIYLFLCLFILSDLLWCLLWPKCLTVNTDYLMVFK
jgi:hypothetical protein